jgi:hypothetical protein
MRTWMPAVGSALVTYIGAPIIYQGLDGGVNVPVVGLFGARAGLAIYSALGTIAGTWAGDFVMPLLPQSTISNGLDKFVPPLVTGGAMYGIMMLGSPIATADLGLTRTVALGAVSNIAGNWLASVWSPMVGGMGHY